MKKVVYILLSFIIGLPLAVAPVLAANTYTASQVAAHNSSTDCWTIINNNVYNLTSYIAQHPGGRNAIISLCGIDGTAAFNSQHSGSTSALAALASLQIGTLVTADTVAPSVPTNLAASAVSISQVNLTWTASTDNVGVVGYNILRNGSALASSTSTSFSDMTTVASTTYSYTVNAFDAAGNTSPVSAPVTITTPLASSDTSAPSVPTNLTATTVSATQVNLSWTASTDNVGVVGYKIIRNGTLLGTATSTSVSDMTTVASTTYGYTVSAFDAAGNNSAQSVSASVTTPGTATDTTAPSMPTGLSASLNSSNKVVLSWTAATDNVGVTGYVVMRNGSSLATTTTAGFTDTSVVASSTYVYSVVAFDAAGNMSPASTNVSISIPAANPNPGNENENENDGNHGTNNNGDNGNHGDVNHGDNGNHGQSNNGHSDNSNNHGQVRASQVSHSTNHSND